MAAGVGVLFSKVHRLRVIDPMQIRFRSVRVGLSSKDSRREDVFGGPLAVVMVGDG
jgi:hypothetical protein